jgi:hypothetical protein
MTITRPEESYRLWRVVVCDNETSCDEEAIARAGLQSQRKKNNFSDSDVLHVSASFKAIFGHNGQTVTLVGNLNMGGVNLSTLIMNLYIYGRGI